MRRDARGSRGSLTRARELPASDHRNRDVILLTIAYFCMAATVYGFTFWLPNIIKKFSGSSDLVVSLLSAPVFGVGVLAILLIGWSSDRTKERRWHAAIPMVIASTGLFLAVASKDHLGLAIAMFSVAAIGMYGYLPGFWSLPTSFLTGTAAAAPARLPPIREGCPAPASD